MAPHLQHLSVLWPVDSERPAAVGRLALCGGRHGQLVWQARVCDTSLFTKPALILTLHLVLPMDLFRRLFASIQLEIFNQTCVGAFTTRTQTLT